MMKSFLLWLLPVAVMAADDECSLYLAVSTTSMADEPKWGVYAGVDFERNVPIGLPDVAVQIHNLMANVMKQEDTELDIEETKTLQRKSADMLEKYTWVADSTGGAFELDKGKVNSAVPGLSLLVAYDPVLTNAAFNQSSAYFRPSIGEYPGESHPGRGASSHFYNVALRSTSIIMSGSELFMDYGDNFAEEQDPQDSILTVSDHRKVDEMIESMVEFLDKYKDELDEKAKKEIYTFLIHDVLSAAAGPKKGKKVADILPDNPDDLAKVKEAGGSLVFGSPHVKRELSWLQKEGMCLDNLVVGASTIPHAGRGAFARRDIAEGSMIAPVPLIHMPDKSVMDMHDLDIDKHSYRISDDVLEQQLLVNYCFGHPESSMLLFPAGSTVSLVNHDSVKANAKLVWSERSWHQAHWLEMDPADLVKESHQYLGLLMELVATKPIAKGEEVFLDYGKEWQEAWDKHVQEWNAKVASGEIPSEWPLRALDLNEEYKSKPFKTPDEMEEDPYPEDVVTACFLAVNEDDFGEGSDDNPKSWGLPKGGDIYSTEHVYSCVVKDRIELDVGKNTGATMPYNYTVTAGRDKQLTLSKVPHQAIVFMDASGKGDQFVPLPFRHPIAIQDDIFPQGPWRDLAKK